MSVFGLLLFLVVAGIVLYMFPIEGTIRKIIIGVILIVAVVWLFAAFGLVSSPVLLR